MSAAAEGVRDFHEFFGFPTRSTPTVITGDELELRKTLIREEYEELIEAMDAGDLSEIAKEAADLLYVVYGLQWHVGLDFDRAFGVVQASNMSKLWHVECEHCNSTGRDPLPGKDLICQACHGEKEARYRHDGKVLKPPTYVKPDLSEIT